MSVRRMRPWWPFWAYLASMVALFVFIRMGMPWWPHGAIYLAVVNACRILWWEPQAIRNSRARHGYTSNRG